MISLKIFYGKIVQVFKRKNQHEKVTHIIVEQRGHKEDAELELEFRRICDRQNYKWY